MLHLAAADAADLSIISAQMQDAVLRREDLRFEPTRRRFALIANRFAWDALPAKQRRRAGLRFDDVEQVQATGLSAARHDTILSLLAIGFSKSDELGGFITLTFANGISIRLKVACINVALDDLGSAWVARHVPAHQD